MFIARQNLVALKDRSMSEDKKEFKKLDTFATYTALVRLAADPKAYVRDDGSHDVVLTFCDSSRFENLEDMWVDARIGKNQSERAKKLRKGDHVQVSGKLRFKAQNNGTIRGKIYDAQFSSFAQLSEREEISPEAKFE